MKLTVGFKKYKYLISEKIKKKYKVFKKKKQSTNLNHSELVLEPLAVDKLPYPVKWNEVFKKDKVSVEIGCGHGELLKHLATKNKNSAFVGFEITKTYTRKTNNGLKTLENGIAFQGDGYSNTLNLFSDDSIDAIYVLFPDPWHKKRHHKRRPLVATWFNEVSDRLKNGGFIFFATDWEEYFDFVEDETKLISDNYTIEKGIYVPEDHDLPETHYYLKWKAMNRKFQYIKMIKKC